MRERQKWLRLTAIGDESWQVRWFPELCQFVRGKDRDDVWRDALSRATHGMWLVHFLVILLGGIFLEKVLTRMLDPYLPLALPPWLVSFPVAWGLIVLAMLLMLQRIRRRVELFLRERLRERGEPICMSCGYNLHGQLDPRCPECGVRFDVRLLQSHAGKTEQTSS